jgi:hypothetical protein
MPRLQMRSFVPLVVLAISACRLPLHAQVQPGAPDANLYISYFFESENQNIDWVVCGSTETTEGCYGSGTIGPFGKAGAMIESRYATINSTTDTVTRLIYVIDIASGTSGQGVTLYVYRRTDNITSSSDTTTITLVKTLPLSLAGGTAVSCYMAANLNYLFIGTDQSPFALKVEKSNFAVTEVGGFSPPINVSSITSDPYGFVTVTFGGFLSGESGFYQFNPNGEGVQDGGGAWFMLNSSLGVSTSTLPTSDALPNRPLWVRPKISTDQSRNTSR